MNALERNIIRGGVNSQFDLTQNSTLYHELLNNTVPGSYSDAEVDETGRPLADDELVDGGETNETKLLDSEI